VRLDAVVIFNEALSVEGIESFAAALPP